MPNHQDTQARQGILERAKDLGLRQNFKFIYPDFKLMYALLDVSGPLVRVLVLSPSETSERA